MMEFYLKLCSQQSVIDRGSLLIKSDAKQHNNNFFKRKKRIIFENLILRAIFIYIYMCVCVCVCVYVYIHMYIIKI